MVHTIAVQGVELVFQSHKCLFGFVKMKRNSVVLGNLLKTKEIELIRPVAGGGAGAARAPPEIFRLELNSATKVELFLLKWTAVNGS